jgi:ribosome biogenesis protein ERB1
MPARKGFAVGEQAQKRKEEEEDEEMTEEDSAGNDSDDSDESDDNDDDDDDDEDVDDEDEDDVDDEDDNSSVDNGSEDGSSDDGFEQQSSSGSENSYSDEEDDDKEVEEMLQESEAAARKRAVGVERSRLIEESKLNGDTKVTSLLHTDDLSSDDEEDVNANTIGRVPLHWYDAYDHIGYTVTGDKIVKRKGKDRIDLALAHHDGPNANRTVYDMYNDREIVLSDRDLEIIRRLQAGAFAHPEHDDTPDYIDYFSSQKELMPLSAAPEPKRNFIPSKWETMKVMKIVQAMKEGRYKTLDEREKERKEKDLPPTYMIWNDAEDDVLAESKRYQYHLPAPKMPLPGHAESYNPPPEYILTEEEAKAMEAMDPSDRPYNFIPKKHDNLRQVAGYKNFMKERFDRCLDLYLCPRKLKKRLNIDPQSLIPQLPKPRELRPYPNSLCLQYLGHKGKVTTIGVSIDGQYLCSGSDDGTVRVWEVDTCLCRYTWTFGKPIVSVQWNPNPSHHIVAVVVDKAVVLITPGTGDADSTDITESLLSTFIAVAKESSGVPDEEDEEEEVDEDGSDSEPAKASQKKPVKWSIYSKKSFNISKAEPLVTKFGATVGPRLVMHFRSQVTHIAWHHKGDYLVTMAPKQGAQAVSIHQLSKGKTQCPFSKTPGVLQAVAFHPSRPFLFVVTQQHVKIYHLIEQKLMKRLLSGSKWLSSIDIHPSGDHIILGSYDRRVIWFDLDLASTPYKVLKFHEKAVRAVQYHKRYPLMASASDDGSVHVFHATVYSDLSRNPMIVPLKVLKGHGVVGGNGVTGIAFHPKQPWIFSAGADGIINLYQDI